MSQLTFERPKELANKLVVGMTAMLELVGACWSLCRPRRRGPLATQLRSSAGGVGLRTVRPTARGTTSSCHCSTASKGGIFREERRRFSASHCGHGGGGGGGGGEHLSGRHRKERLICTAKLGSEKGGEAGRGRGGRFPVEEERRRSAGSAGENAGGG